MARVRLTDEEKDKRAAAFRAKSYADLKKYGFEDVTQMLKPIWGWRSEDAFEWLRRESGTHLLDRREQPRHRHGGHRNKWWYNGFVVGVKGKDLAERLEAYIQAQASMKILAYDFEWFDYDNNRGRMYEVETKVLAPLAHWKRTGRSFEINGAADGDAAICGIEGTRRIQHGNHTLDYLNPGPSRFVFVAEGPDADFHFKLRFNFGAR